MFGLVFAGLFGLIAALTWFIGGRVPTWAAALGATLLLLATIAPGLLLPLNRLWGRLGRRLGIVSNYLLLGAFFYLVIVPFGATARVLRRSSIDKRPDEASESYWTPVARQATAQSFFDMF
jgi:hypothetical protein